MRYTTKMLLVPEDVYKELVAAASSRQTNTSLKLEPVDDGEKQLIAQNQENNEEDNEKPPFQSGCMLDSTYARV